MQLLDNKDRIGSLLILAFSVAYLRLPLGLPVDPIAGEDVVSASTLPVGLASAAILFSFVQLFLSRRTGDGARVSEAVSDFNWRPALLLLIAMAVYAALFDVLGFILSSASFLFLGFLILGERRMLLGAGVAALLVLSLWGILTQAFGLYLDPGDLYRFIAGVLA